MLSRNRTLLSAVAVVFFCQLLVACSAGAQDPFYAIAHMTNTQKAVDWAVEQGANALEVDLQFDAQGHPVKFMHGGSCDCTCMPDYGVCSQFNTVGSKCDVMTPAADLLEHIATKSSIALLVIDSKADKNSNGAEVVKLLADHLFDKKFKGKVVIGTSKLTEFPYISAAGQAVQDYSFASRVYFTIDQEGKEGKDVYAVVHTLLFGVDVNIPSLKPIHIPGIPSKNVVYGTGISACGVGNYERAILVSYFNRKAGVIGLNYIWTLNVESSMEKYIADGAQGIMTNFPGTLVALLQKKGIPLATPETPIPASRNGNVLADVPVCRCTSRPGGCAVTAAAPAGLACDCFNSALCLGAVVPCKDPASPFCTTPGTTLQHCQQGGGNCGGYPPPPPPPPPPAIACSVNAGPIWNQSHANQVCPRTCGDSRLGAWTGQWWTTVPGSMSVCQCRPSERWIDAGPLRDYLDANARCPGVCTGAHGAWTGSWTSWEETDSSSCWCQVCAP